MSRGAEMTMTCALLLITLAVVSPAAAYTQNTQLEQDLARSDPKALAHFPAKGFKDGVAGFFRTQRLYVVPNSQRAWCQDNNRGILKPGCYVEFFIQVKGLKPKNSRGDSCGLPGRWYRAPGSESYIPTPGAFISNAIANGEWDIVLSALYDDSSARELHVGGCDRTMDRPARN